LVHVQLHPKAEISPHNRSQCEHESHSLSMAMLLLFLPLADAATEWFQIAFQ
jgi:hypothetical protein